MEFVSYGEKGKSTRLSQNWCGWAARFALTAGAPFWPSFGAYFGGTLKSLQIFLARSSLISECRGTAEVLPAVRLT
jgi:hypothetical protein